MELNNNVYMCMFLLVIILFIFMYRHTLLKKESFSDTEYVQVYGRRARMGEPCPPLRKSECQQNDGNKYHCLQSYSASSNNGSRFCKWESDEKTCRATDDRCSPPAESPAQEIESFTNSTEYVQVNGRRARTGDPCPPLRRSECQENNGNRTDCLRAYSSGRNGNRFCQWKPDKNQCKTTGERCNVAPAPPPPSPPPPKANNANGEQCTSNLIGQCSIANNNKSLCQNAHIINTDNNRYQNCDWRDSDKRCNSGQYCNKSGSINSPPKWKARGGVENNAICVTTDGKTQGGLRKGHLGISNIMNMNKDQIRNACINYANSRYGKDGYSAITVHPTGDWWTRGCDIHHGQSNEINTSHWSGKHCSFNSNYKGGAVKGCTNFQAENYNNKANHDDGSCIIRGCTVKTPIRATNYNSRATHDDGSCIIKGCTNPQAANYAKTANTDDGTCQIGGCTDSKAKNMNKHATFDDGSCKYIKYGCMESGAENYDPSVEKSDGSCTWPPPPPPNYYSVGTCGIQYDSGMCVKSNGNSRSTGVHKLDDVDKGTSNSERNMECYKRARLEHGANLKGVQVSSGSEGSSKNGCYAYTKNISKGNKASGEICHVIGKHKMTCDIDINPEECDAMLERKKLLNIELSNLNKKLEETNKDLDKNVTQMTNELLNRYGQVTADAFKQSENKIIIDEQNELKGRLDLIDLSHDSVDSTGQDPYSSKCKNETAIGLLEATNKELELKKNNEIQRFSSETKKRKISRLKIMGLRTASELKEKEHNLKITNQEESNRKEREALENELQARIDLENIRAQKLKQEQELAFKKMQLAKQQEISRLKDLKAAKDYEHKQKTIELAKSRADAIKQAKLLAKTKQQRDAMDAALKDELKNVANMEQLIKETRAKQLKERVALKLKIDNMFRDLEECNRALDDTINTLTEVERNVAECSLFVRQMQRLQPALI